MRDVGNGILLENDSGRILIEDGTGIVLLESAPESIILNNYLHVTAGDGMSTAEKSR
jgi:hypothetical protein